MEFYRLDMDDRGLVDFDCAYEANDPARSIAQQIIDYSEKISADFVAVGQRPYVGAIPMTRCVCVTE